MKRIISASLIAATLSIFLADTTPLFAQGTDRYQRFKGTTSNGRYCDDLSDRLFTDPNFELRDSVYSFDEGFVYKGLFDNQSAEVLAGFTYQYGVCRYFRTPNGIVHKINIGINRKTAKHFLLYNGKEAKLLSKIDGRGFDPVKPLSFMDSKGIKHTIVIYREIIPNP
jgi:hypothetical protein